MPGPPGDAAGLRAANARLRNLLAGRDAEIVALRARVAQAEGLVVDLREQVAPQPQPLTASSTARTTTIDPVRAGGMRLSLPGSRPPLPTCRVATRFPEPMPVMTQRWPCTGSACKPAIRSPNASSPRCSAAPPTAGRVPGSPMLGNHHKDPAEKWPGAGIQDLQRGTASPAARLGERGSWRRQVRPRPPGAGMLASALRYTPRVY